MNLLIIITLCLTACTKEPLPQQPCTGPDCDTVKPTSMALELLWQIPLRLDKDYTVSDACPITPDYAVFRYDEVEQEKLLFVHKTDTTHKRFFGPNKGDYLNVFYHPGVGIIAMDSWSVFTGKTAAMKKIATVPSGLQFQTKYNLYGDYIYGNLGYWNEQRQYYFRLNVYSGAIEYIRTVNHEECSECEMIGLYGPDFFTLSNGTTIMSKMILYSKTATPGGEIRTVRELSLIKSNEIIPLRTETNPTILFQKINVIAYKDNLIVTTRDSIYCIEPISNQKIWVRENKRIDNAIPQYGTNRILIGNKIVSILDGHYTEINADNGDMYVGEKLADGSINSHLSYCNGVVYWGTNDQAYSWIYGVRMSDRKLMIRMRSPNWGKPPYYNDAIFDRRGLVIDTAAGRGYTHDGFFAQCYTLL